MKKKKGTSHSSQISRLNRIEGQVRGLSKMVEEGRYCIDIVTQMKAIRSALNAVEANIINEHLNHCLTKAMSSKNKSETSEMLNEIKMLLKKSR
ncbi:MAG: hypothetical protein CL678_14300 [Bdellovibrionaceae bacterium]|nr:hypothetical protein [Pseudobdellovibrionaceae bacterium]